MKQITITIAIVWTFLTIMSFSNSDNKSIEAGAIGDVKYSILPPNKFREENGTGWVLMDDKIPLNGSDLSNKHGITNIPDARGLFIRGLNLKRNDGYKDPYFNEQNRERQAGDYQSDNNKTHHHFSFNKERSNSGNDHTLRLSQDNTPNYCSEGKEFHSSYNIAGTTGIATVGKTSSEGTESRPKNIALYTYIKINE